MIERVLHFSIGQQPQPEQAKVIEIAKSLHPTWEIMVWHDPVSKDELLLGKYHDRARSGAQLADLIRLDVVYRYGGVYLDSDVRLVKPLDELCRYENFFCSEDGHNLTNAVFGARRQSPVIRAVIDKLLEEEPDWTQQPNETTGPVLFRRVLQWRQDITLLPRDSFYPYNWNEEPCAPLNTTIGVHEWAGSWDQNKDQKRQQSKSFIPNRLRVSKEAIRGCISGISARLAPIVTAQLRRLRLLSGSPYPFGTDLIAKTNRGLIMSLSGEDLSITPEVALFGTYEEPELTFIQKTLKGGDFFVDVGCNVGVFTLVAAQAVGPFGRVFAFDPNHEVIKHLRRSLVMNWVHDRVKIFENAVGAREEMVTFNYTKDRMGGGSVVLEDNPTFENRDQGEYEVIEKQVKSVTLDDVFPLSVEIKVLKIDVVGFEYAAFQGGKRLLKDRAINYVIIELIEEIAPVSYQMNIDAVQGIVALGYRVCRVDGRGNLIPCESLRDALKSSRNLILERI